LFSEVFTALLTSYLTGKAIIASVLAGIPLFIFSRVMPAKTKTGASAYMEVLGFQESQPC
jgi:hypothetical protein